jgi:Gas vesicle protein K
VRKPVVKKTRKRRQRPSVAARPVTARELRALGRQLERQTMRSTARKGGGPAPRKRARGRKTALRWNPDPEEVQKSVAQLVLTLVEFLRRLMERQAIRRMEEKTLTPKEVEAVGVGLMKLEETIREIGRRFGLTPEDLNLDLGALKLM